MLRQFSAGEVDAALDYPDLIGALAEAFAKGDVEAPERHAHEVGPPGAPAHMLLMPAWRRGALMGVKVVNVFPGNARLGIGGVSGSYLVFDGATGVPLAMMDGSALTSRRTAAASALASRHLSRPDSRSLLMIGAGRLAPHLIAAHASVRPIEAVRIHARRPEPAEALAARLREQGFKAEAVSDLAAATAESDIISCATSARAALVRGADVRPGTHVDLVGAFTFEMRESDDALILKSSIFADTRAGVLSEAGDLLQPMAAGLWSADQLKGELHDLCAGAHPGRTDDAEITLFKSVGEALEDLVAAELVLAHAGLLPGA